MKTLLKNLLVFCLIWFAGFFVMKCSAQTTVYSGQKITSTDTVTVEVELNNTMWNPTQIVYIQVDSANTGTIKFTIARTGTTTPIKPASRYKAWGPGARIPMSIDNGRYNLFYKASASGNSFTITE